MPAIALRILGSRWLHYALLSLAAWGAWQRADHWKAKYDALHKEAGLIVAAIEQATGYRPAWKEAPGAIVAMGQTVRSQRVEIEATNQRLDDMAREAIQRRANAVRKREIADKARASRRAAHAKLATMAATSSETQDCMSLLGEAETALNLLREASE